MIGILHASAAVVAGMLLAVVLVIAVEAFGAIAHPFPSDFGGTQEEMCQHVERFPAWVLTVVVAAWAGLAFAGTWTAAKLGNMYSGLIVGLLLVAALILNLSMLPYPIWFKTANLVAIPVAIAAGIYAIRRRTTATHI